jgi:hypothetical protein
MAGTGYGPERIFTRTSYVEGGKAEEYVKSAFRGDRYKITNRLGQPRNGNSSEGNA